MSDVVDEGNRHAQMFLDHAIAAATKPQGPGRPDCEICGEAISEFRQLLGSRKCIDCQRDFEHGTRRP